MDSRWVCKIDDYGFHHLKRMGSPGGVSNKWTADDLLWTAPELLEQDCHIPGSKKADVFSFGIVIQEIMMQSYPYSHNDGNPTPEMIIKYVRSRQNPTYRPQIPQGNDSDIDFLQLVRPLFQYLSFALRLCKNYEKTDKHGEVEQNVT